MSASLLQFGYASPDITFAAVFLCNSFKTIRITYIQLLAADDPSQHWSLVRVQWGAPTQDVANGSSLRHTYKSFKLGIWQSQRSWRSSTILADSPAKRPFAFSPSQESQADR